MLEGSGIDLDVSGETETDPGPPQESSTPSKDQGKKKHLCTFCGNLYTHRQSLHSHVAAIHKKCFQCIICQKAMGSKRTLESHLNGHLKKKPFSCNTCKRVYQSKLSLAQHPCSGKLSKCDECSKVFPTSKCLMQHKLTHNPMPKFACHYCGKDFQHRQSRDRHTKQRCRVAERAKSQNYSE